MKTAVRIFFKKIHIRGLENIPKDKPVIFAANHVNAFMDAIVVAVFIQHQLYFLTRSDVFNTPLKRWILKKMNLLPIYRLQEGADNLHKNEQVFTECYQLLAKNKSILIFSEGICIQEKRLQKLKKGTARIAFGAELFKNFEMDLQVVPVGINYNKPSQFRSNLNLHFGASIGVNDYATLYKSDENKATYQFTRDLEQQMIEQLIHLKFKTQDTFYEQLTEFYTNEWRMADKSNQNEFKIQSEVAFFLNSTEGILSPDAEALKRKLNGYFGKLKKLGLKDKFVKVSEKNSGTLLILKSILATLGLPIHLLSLLLNYIPYKLPSVIAYKLCKHIEFVSSVIIGCAAFLFLIFFMGWGFILASFTNIWLIKLLAFIIAPVLAYFSMHYYSFLKRLQMNFKLFFNAAIKSELQLEREGIQTLIEKNFSDKLKIQNE